MNGGRLRTSRRSAASLVASLLRVEGEYRNAATLEAIFAGRSYQPPPPPRPPITEGGDNE